MESKLKIENNEMIVSNTNDEQRQGDNIGEQDIRESDNNKKIDSNQNNFISNYHSPE